MDIAHGITFPTLLKVFMSCNRAHEVYRELFSTFL